MEQPFFVPGSTADNQKVASAGSSPQSQQASIFDSPQRESPIMGSGLRTERDGQSYESGELAKGSTPSFNRCHITNVYCTPNDTRSSTRPSGRTSVGGYAMSNTVPLSRPRVGMAHQSTHPRMSPPCPRTRPPPLRVRSGRILPTAPPLDRLWSRAENSGKFCQPYESSVGGMPFPYVNANSSPDHERDSCASDCDSSSASISSCDSHSSTALPEKTRGFEGRSTYRRYQHDDLLDRAGESRYRFRDTLEHMRTKLEDAESELEIAKQEIYRLSMARVSRIHSPAETDGVEKNDGQEKGSAESDETGEGNAVKADTENRVSASASEVA